MARPVKSTKTRRYRAKLKAKKRKERLRKAGVLKKLKPGGRMKPKGLKGRRRTPTPS